MVNSITSISSAYTQDALKYINGIELNNSTSLTEDVSGAITSVPFCSGISGAMFAGGRLMKRTGEEYTSIFGKTKSKMAGIKGLTDTLSSVKDVMYKNDTLNAILQGGKGLEGASKNLEATTLIKDLLKDKNGSAETVSKITNTINKSTDADSLIDGLKKLSGNAGGATKKASKFSKAAKWVSETSLAKTIAQTPAANSLKAAGKEFLTTTKAGQAIAKGAGNFSKAYKTSGAGINVAIEGVIALFTDVMPAFTQGGIGEGVKQVAKSGAKVAASTAGWVGGAAIGKAAGAAIGTAICPGIGTAIGGFIGDMVCGVIGSSILGKVTEKIVGEDYTDKVQNEQTAEQAAQIENNSGLLSELNQTVLAKIQEDMADDGKLTKDSEKMLEYLNSDEMNTINSDSTILATSSGTTGLDELIGKIQTGDKSVYDVPAEVLEASAKSCSATIGEGFANNYTNFGMQNPYLNSNADSNTNNSSDKTFNYFMDA